MAVLYEKARMSLLCMGMIPRAMHETEWPICGVGGVSLQFFEAYSGFPYLATRLYVMKAKKPRSLVGVLHYGELALDNSVRRKGLSETGEAWWEQTVNERVPRQLFGDYYHRDR